MNRERSFSSSCVYCFHKPKLVRKCVYALKCGRCLGHGVHHLHTTPNLSHSSVPQSQQVAFLDSIGGLPKTNKPALADDARNFVTYKQREQTGREIDCHRERERERQRENERKRTKRKRNREREREQKEKPREGLAERRELPRRSHWSNSNHDHG